MNFLLEKVLPLKISLKIHEWKYRKNLHWFLWTFSYIGFLSESFINIYGHFPKNFVHKRLLQSIFSIYFSYTKFICYSFFRPCFSVNHLLHNFSQSNLWLKNFFITIFLFLQIYSMKIFTNFLLRNFVYLN